ncbi:hypothetical protein GW17_00032158 [Ensete ventricosum]|nr:hypothetical protein GW17_00032158 [Ensete ventricosum]
MNWANGSLSLWLILRRDATVGLRQALARKFNSNSLVSWSKQKLRKALDDCTTFEQALARGEGIRLGHGLKGGANGRCLSICRIPEGSSRGGHGTSSSGHCRTRGCPYEGEASCCTDV